MEFTLYKLTAILTGKSYIGQTKHLGHRLGWHRKHNAALFEAGFTVEVLASAWSVQGASDAEAFLVQSHNTLEPHGYNRQGGGLKGYRRSERYRAVADSAPRDEHGRFAFDPTAHHKFTEADRAKMGHQAKGNTWSRGRKVSEETRAKQRASKLAFYAAHGSPLKGSRKVDGKMVLANG